jgi:hypothetical protein
MPAAAESRRLVLAIGRRADVLSPQRPPTLFRNREGEKRRQIQQAPIFAA